MIIACNSYHYYYCTAAILTHHSILHTQELLIALVWNSHIPILLHNIVLDLYSLDTLCRRTWLFHQMLKITPYHLYALDLAHGRWVGLVDGSQIPNAYRIRMFNLSLFACLLVDCRCSHQKELLSLVVCFTHILWVRKPHYPCMVYTWLVQYSRSMFGLFILPRYSILITLLKHVIISGHGLVLQHFRRNEECGVLEELEPVDINLKYDFNYQVWVIVSCVVYNLYFCPSIVIMTCCLHMFSKLTSYQEKFRYCQ